LILPWGIAMPCPRPVEPSFSRADSASTTAPRATSPLASKSPATDAKRSRLFAASTPTATLD
jgi:hypothetical protein